LLLFSFDGMETARRAAFFCSIGACPELIEGSPDRAKKRSLCALCASVVNRRFCPWEHLPSITTTVTFVIHPVIGLDDRL
jgi:hypothetical protein